MTNKETLEALRRKIDGAYGNRDDYPPFKMTPFEDRPAYHAFINKLIMETIEEADD
jgi:hypothetical protein